MIVVGVGAFVGPQRRLDVMVVGGDLGGELGFFEGVINNLVRVADPAAAGLVRLGWV